MRKVVHTKKAPQPRGVYSQAIVAGGFVFVAGQACVNPKTNEYEFGDIQSETRQTLNNISAILKAAGSSLKDVVRVGVFLADLNEFAAMNEIYKQFFPKTSLPAPPWAANFRRSRLRSIASRVSARSIRRSDGGAFRSSP